MSVPGPVVVMGVSGSGKTTLGRAVADALDAPFCEGDDLHPPGNVAKMAAGEPLTDTDRWPWLDVVGAWLAAGAGWRVATCSALRRAYRDRLISAAPGTRFLWLDVPQAELAHRLALRQGHYMPASLLGSQLATLEPPMPDEPALRIEGALGMGPSVDSARAWLMGLSTKAE